MQNGSSLSELSLIIKRIRVFSFVLADFSETLQCTRNFLILHSTFVFVQNLKFLVHFGVSAYMYLSTKYALQARAVTLIKGPSHGYLLYFCHKFAELPSKDLAHAQIAFRLLRKQNKVNLERITSQNQFLLISSEIQEYLSRKKICQKFSSWRPFPSWPLSIRHIY